MFDELINEIFFAVNMSLEWMNVPAAPILYVKYEISYSNMCLVSELNTTSKLLLDHDSDKSTCPHFIGRTVNAADVCIFATNCLPSVVNSGIYLIVIVAIYFIIYLY